MIPPLSNAPAAPAPPQPSRQLKQAAQEFEGMLISSMWKELQDDPMTAPDDSDPAGDSIRSLGLQAMSTALAASGGLGWAQMVERQLAPKQPENTVAPSLKPTSGPADNRIERSRPAAAGGPS